MGRINSIKKGDCVTHFFLLNLDQVINYYKQCHTMNFSIEKPNEVFKYKRKVYHWLIYIFSQQNTENDIIICSKTFIHTKLEESLYVS